VLKRFNLPHTSRVPLIGFIGRLDPYQKGIGILLEAFEQLIRKFQIQLVILGTGDQSVISDIRRLSKKHSDSMASVIGFDEKLARHMYAGTDMMVIPSHYEPCGLVQLIAMRYGSIPLVRKTGGLADTVKHKKTGFVFDAYTGTALAACFEEAITIYCNQRRTWDTLVTSVMKEDFSWKRSAREYVQLYKRLSCHT
jgi:starch synthase